MKRFTYTTIVDGLVRGSMEERSRCFVPSEANSDVIHRTSLREKRNGSSRLRKCCGPPPLYLDARLRDRLIGVVVAARHGAECDEEKGSEKKAHRSEEFVHVTLFPV